MARLAGGSSGSRRKFTTNPRNQTLTVQELAMDTNDKEIILKLQEEIERLKAENEALKANLKQANEEIESLHRAYS